MEKFRTGKSEEGHDRFSVPLQPDDEGMVGRECPNDECETKYFKVSLLSEGKETGESGVDVSNAEMVCPYCGEEGHFQHFHTADQIEWVKSMLFRDVAKSFGDTLARAFSSQPVHRRSLISISVSVKRGQLPSVRHYAEEKLRQTVVCDACWQK